MLLLLALQSLTVQPLAPPVQQGMYPRPLAQNNGVTMSWMDRDRESSGFRLRSSSWVDGAWSAPQVVAAGKNWFVNWADFPAVANTDGLSVAFWLQKTAKKGMAYEVGLALQGAEGKWREAGILHKDRRPGEHGFVSLVPLAGAQVFAVWLDGGSLGAAKDKSTAGMEMHAAVVGAAGPQGEHILDSQTCECCSTDAVLLPTGEVMVVYRDKSPGEIRDIAFVRGIPGNPSSFTKPRLVHEDGWRVPGCPVNGPAVATQGPAVAVAWYTMGSQGKSSVRAAWWDAKSSSFGDAIEISDKSPLGRVDLAPLVHGGMVVSWLESVGRQAQWMARTLAADGSLGESVVVGKVEGGRGDGFLRLCSTQNGVLAGWSTAKGHALHVALISPMSP